MTGEPVRRGLLDTNIMILRSRIAPEELPDEMAISAVTLAELSAGPHEVRPDTEQDVYFEAAERARRLDVLQRAEHEFDPIPFDTDAARAYGRVTAAVIAAGRKPRRRAVDLMIVATAIAASSPCTRQIPVISQAWITSYRDPGNQAGSPKRARI